MHKVVEVAGTWPAYLAGLSEADRFFLALSVIKQEVSEIRLAIAYRRYGHTDE